MLKLNMVQKIIAALILFSAASSCKQATENKWELTSPDKNLKISLMLDESQSGQTSLTYLVQTFKNGKEEMVVEKSPLGIECKNQSFSNNLGFVSAGEVKTINETYKMAIGRRAEIRNYANELEVNFKNDKGTIIQVVLRAYNDGVAFKYVFPDTSDSLVTVTKELTSFKIPVSGKAWIAPYDVPSQWSPAYEKYYENGVPIGTPSPNKEGWAFPALFNSNGYWILISESNLGANYCGIRLEQNADSGNYRVRFPEPEDGMGQGETEPVMQIPASLPWRAIIIGNSPGTIYESQIINNLADKTLEGDFSWVKPGRASWSWLSENDSPKNFDALKSFVDLSSQMKWEYSLVDANWDLMKGGNIEQLVKYANSKGIGILMWYNSGGPHNKVTERPREIIFNKESRRAEFKKLSEWGVKGVKIDFWHSDKQNLIAYYLDVLKDAAEFKIMVNFHGCTIPRGWSRTWPNLVSMEAVRGEECYLFDSVYTAQAPVQNTILPFTRNVIGPMDYTPVGFSDLRNPHITTFSHELALAVVFNSGILHFADNVKTYTGLPSFVKEYLANIPAVFDETVYISGEPGKSIIVASRKGNNWYISGINGEKELKELTVEIPYITEGQYSMNLIDDGEDDKSFGNEVKDFKAGDKIGVKMLGNGGFVAVLTAK
ncbi:MAG: glycoside hydrolase family 97 catalytic domain-containing protein [Bacteroidales bacterium]